jgi:hypothetical protein
MANRSLRLLRRDQCLHRRTDAPSAPVTSPGGADSLYSQRSYEDTSVAQYTDWDTSPNEITYLIDKHCPCLCACLSLFECSLVANAIFESPQLGVADAS